MVAKNLRDTGNDWAPNMAFQEHTFNALILPIHLLEAPLTPYRRWRVQHVGLGESGHS